MDRKKLLVRARFFPLCLKYHELKGSRQCRLLVSNHCERKESFSSNVDIYELLKSSTSILGLIYGICDFIFCSFVWKL